MITIKEIADIADVSRGTVDRVINNRGGVDKKTEEKIRKIIDTSGYIPNAAGRNLALKKKKLKYAELFTQWIIDNEDVTIINLCK